MVKVNETVMMWTILQDGLLRVADRRPRASRGSRAEREGRKVTWKLARLQNSYRARCRIFRRRILAPDIPRKRSSLTSTSGHVGFQDRARLSRRWAREAWNARRDVRPIRFRFSDHVVPTQYLRHEFLFPVSFYSKRFERSRGFLDSIITRGFFVLK